MSIQDKNMLAQQIRITGLFLDCFFSRDNPEGVNFLRRVVLEGRNLGDTTIQEFTPDLKVLDVANVLECKDILKKLEADNIKSDVRDKYKREIYDKLQGDLSKFTPELGSYYDEKIKNEIDVAQNKYISKLLTQTVKAATLRQDSQTQEEFMRFSNPYDLVSFDTNTEFSSDEAKIMAEILENNKGMGLGINKVHQQGITGKGVNIALIDYPVGIYENCHQEIRGRVKYIDNERGKVKPHMHGVTTSSLIIGKECGVAPDANLYCFGVSFQDSDNVVRSCLQEAQALEKILEHNKSHSEEDKIHIVSISACHYPEYEGYKEYQEALKKIKEAGVVVISADMWKDYGLHFNGLNRDPQGDINNPESYQAITNKIDKRIITDKWFAKDDKKNLMFPCDHLTTASEMGEDAYRHDTRGGVSWIVPQIAGLYALAMQVDKNCSIEKFWETGLRTATYREDAGMIVCPTKLIKYLQNERAQTMGLQQDKHNTR